MKLNIKKEEYVMVFEAKQTASENLYKNLVNEPCKFYITTRECLVVAKNNARMEYRYPFFEVS